MADPQDEVAAAPTPGAAASTDPPPSRLRPRIRTGGMVVVRVMEGSHASRVPVDLDWTVQVFKEKMERLTGNPSDRLRVILSGRELESGRLRDCGVAEGCILYVAVRCAQTPADAPPRVPPPMGMRPPPPPYAGPMGIPPPPQGMPMPHRHVPINGANGNVVGGVVEWNIPLRVAPPTWPGTPPPGAVPPPRAAGAQGQPTPQPQPPRPPPFAHPGGPGGAAPHPLPLFLPSSFPPPPGAPPGVAAALPMGVPLPPPPLHVVAPAVASPPPATPPRPVCPIQGLNIVVHAEPRDLDGLSQRLDSFNASLQELQARRARTQPAPVDAQAPQPQPQPQPQPHIIPVLPPSGVRPPLPLHHGPPPTPAAAPPNPAAPPVLLQVANVFEPYPDPPAAAAAATEAGQGAPASPAARPPAPAGTANARDATSAAAPVAGGETGAAGNTGGAAPAAAVAPPPQPIAAHTMSEVYTVPLTGDGTGEAQVTSLVSGLLGRSLQGARPGMPMPVPVQRPPGVPMPAAHVHYHHHHHGHHAHAHAHVPFPGAPPPHDMPWAGQPAVPGAQPQGVFLVSVVPDNDAVGAPPPEPEAPATPPQPTTSHFFAAPRREG